MKKITFKKLESISLDHWTTRSFYDTGTLLFLEKVDFNKTCSLNEYRDHMKRLQENITKILKCFNVSDIQKADFPDLDDTDFQLILINVSKEIIIELKRLVLLIPGLIDNPQGSQMLEFSKGTLDSLLEEIANLLNYPFTSMYL